MTADLVVVGGGPVGLATAIAARLAGLEPVVLEARTGPLDKACGEGLMPGALAVLARLGVDPPGVPLRGFRYADSRRSVEHRFPGPAGRGVERVALQRALADRTGGPHTAGTWRSSPAPAASARPEKQN